MALLGHTITFDRVHKQLGVARTTVCDGSNATAGVPPNYAGSAAWGVGPSTAAVWTAAVGVALALGMV